MALDWNTADPSEWGWSRTALDRPCTIPRIDRNFSIAEFEAEWRHQRPFILGAPWVDGTHTWHAAAWTRQEVLGHERSAGATVISGDPESNYVLVNTATTTIAGHVNASMPPRPSIARPRTEREARAQECRRHVGEGGRFVFTRDPETLQATGLPVRTPAILGQPASLPANVLSLAANGSGFPFHLHPEAWLELIAGRKYWTLFSVESTGSPTGGFRHAASHAAWLETQRPRLDVGDRDAQALNSGASGPGGMLECVQEPGELVHVSWSEAVLA